jgi:HEAT repeat protein
VASKSIVCLGIAMTLGCGGPPAAQVAPEITSDQKVEGSLKNLSSDDPVQRCIAVGMLASLGPEAKQHLPAIKKLESDPEESVRKAAKEAVAKIEKG